MASGGEDTLTEQMIDREKEIGESEVSKQFGPSQKVIKRSFSLLTYRCNTLGHRGQQQGNEMFSSTKIVMNNC